MEKTSVDDDAQGTAPKSAKRSFSAKLVEETSLNQDEPASKSLKIADKHADDSLEFDNDFIEKSVRLDHPYFNVSKFEEKFVKEKKQNSKTAPDTIELDSTLPLSTQSFPLKQDSIKGMYINISFGINYFIRLLSLCKITAIYQTQSGFRWVQPDCVQLK